MDPFGFTRLTKYYSQDLLAVAMAGCYPTAHGGPCVKEGRAQTAVVLLRDADLDAFDEPWPPRYGFHARILKAIRANKPKAVVIDIVFEDKRDDPTIAALAADDCWAWASRYTRQRSRESTVASRSRRARHVVGAENRPARSRHPLLRSQGDDPLR